MPEPSQGGLLLRVLYLSLDPYMRGRMNDSKSYAKPVNLGEVMTGESVCEVIASDQAGYAVGDIVLAQTGWRTHATSLGATLRNLSMAPPNIPRVKHRIRNLDMVAATRRARAIMDQSDSGRIAALVDDFNTSAWPH